MLSAEATSVRQQLRQQIVTVAANPLSPVDFESAALAVFRYQATNNPVYREYIRHLAIRPETIATLHQIPFMPIGFFKKHTILTGIHQADATLTNALTFVSSGTTSQQSGSENSRHVVPDPDLYNAISIRLFERMYGPLDSFHILALLPSYLERNNSSLVYMIQQFIATSERSRTTNPAHSGFFLNDYDALTRRLKQLSQPAESGRRILLIGVTFGLLDWAESATDFAFLSQNPNLIVMETGGMKGRRKELLREEVHELLTARLGVETIHSEYGMTELLSQAYSAGNGVFRPSPTLRVFLRDINDPFLLYPENYRRAGGINIVDLANLDSCSFIETQDLGQYVGDEGNFRVIGRFDNSDVRGCNLMVV